MSKALLEPLQVSSVEELRAAIVLPGLSSVWAKKMLHEVPECPTIPNRRAYLTEKAKGHRVLDIGCAGPISQAIRAVAATYYGVDVTTGEWVTVDLDRDPDALPRYDVDVVIASEILEHLSNPGRFLDALHVAYPSHDIYVTVPNAGAYAVKNNREVVNRDHVAWYSYTTLHTLLTRHRFIVQSCRWYHGRPHTAEGLLVKMRAG